MNVRLNAPRSWGSTFMADSSTERSGSAAISAVIRSESFVATNAPATPASAAREASSPVLTRLPLWHSARPVPACRAECRLGVLPGGGAGRRVAGVADCEETAQAAERRLVEHLADQPEVLVDDDGGAVGHRDARRLLTAVLEGVQTEIGQLRDLFTRRPDTEDATGVLRSGIVGVEVVREPSITARHVVERTGVDDIPRCRWGEGGHCARWP